MRARTMGLILLHAVAVAAVAACSQDSIIRFLGPENRPQATLLPDSFRFEAYDMENVNNRLTFAWQVDKPYLAFYHRSFIHHGYGLVIVQDAEGTVVDSTILDWELDAGSDRPGVPGIWTVNIIFATARGRADFSLKAQDSMFVPPPVE